MATHRSCDMCGRKITEENPAVGKLRFSPFQAGKPKSGEANSYTLHLDLGQCCMTKVNQWDWQKRVTRTQAGKARRLRAVAE